MQSNQAIFKSGVEPRTPKRWRGSPGCLAGTTRASIHSGMRFQGLDLLRAVAIALVLGRHFQLATADSFWTQKSAFLDAWYFGGWVGVDLFFALSGFLIGQLLISEWRQTGRVRVSRFLLRRAWKILPPYWLLLAGTAVFRAVENPATALDKPLAADLIFASNYFTGLWPHTWSLAIEVHFYIAAASAAAFFLSARRTLRPFAAVFIIISAGAFAFRAYSWLQPETSGTDYFQAFQFATHRRIDSLLMGALLACAFNHEPFWRRISAIPPRWHLLLGILLLCPVFWVSVEWFQSNPLGFTMIQAGTTCLVVWALTIAPSGNPIVKAIASVGRWSYCIYLYHYPFFAAWREARTRFGWNHVYLEIPALIVSAIAIGGVISWACEAPLLRLRDRVAPRADPGNESGYNHRGTKAQRGKRD